MIGFDGVRRALQWAQAVDDTYMLFGHDKKTYNPWMPFQPADFLGMLAECIPEMSGDRFLDIGSGPGTKVLLASTVFHLNAHGIERDETMARMCNTTVPPIPATVCDALEYEHYNWYDLIWMYRPLNDPALQKKLEDKVFAEAKSGAIVAGAMWEDYPRGWIPVIDDWELRRGAWRKP